MYMQLTCIALNRSLTGEYAGRFGTVMLLSCQNLKPSISGKVYNDHCESCG